jgi:hypothetical protein
MKKILLTLFLLSLTACSGNQVVRTEYIRPDIPELPEEPEYYIVKWQKVGAYGDTPLYCLDADDAKNLMKNIELMKGYQDELREIIEGLRWKDNGIEKGTR